MIARCSRTNVVDVARAREPAEFVRTPVDQYDRLLKDSFPDRYSFTTASCDRFIGVGTDGFSDFLLVYDPVKLDPSGEVAMAFSGFMSPYKLNGYVKKGRSRPSSSSPTRQQERQSGYRGVSDRPPSGRSGRPFRRDCGVRSKRRFHRNGFRYAIMNALPAGDYVFTLTSSKVGSHSGFVAKK